MYGSARSRQIAVAISSSTRSSTTYGPSRPRLKSSAPSKASDTICWPDSRSGSTRTCSMVVPAAVGEGAEHPVRAGDGDVHRHLDDQLVDEAVAVGVDAVVGDRAGERGPAVRDRGEQRLLAGERGRLPRGGHDDDVLAGVSRGEDTGVRVARAVEGELGSGDAVRVADERGGRRAGHRHAVLGDRRGDRHRLPHRVRVLVGGHGQDHPARRRRQQRGRHGVGGPVRCRGVGAGHLQHPDPGRGLLDVIAGVRHEPVVLVRDIGDARLRRRRVDPDAGGTDQLEPQRGRIAQQQEDRRVDRVDDRGVGRGGTAGGDTRPRSSPRQPCAGALPVQRRRAVRRRGQNGQVVGKQVVHDLAVVAQAGVVGQ